MQPSHFYHIWAGDRYHGSNWMPAAGEHFEALESSGFTGDVNLGLVGGMSERAAAMRWLREAWPASQIVVQADEGYEQVTIDQMHAWTKTVDPCTPVYYCHTKGALNDSLMNTRWRRAMESVLTDFWPERVNDLYTYDAVGLHWLTHRDFPEQIEPRKPMFGGNFWWANAGYLAGLGRVTGTPEFPPVNRWEAEGWMGQDYPKILDLSPGWPDYTRDNLIALG